MVSAFRVLRVVAIGAALAVATEAAYAFEAEELAELGDRHFAQLFGFNSVEAYVASVGPASAGFVLARHWKNGEARLIVDIEQPQAFSKWALLVFHRSDRSDDVFIRIPNSWNKAARVRRFTATPLEREVLFNLLPLGDLRPFAPGELAYEQLGDTEVDGETCTVVRGVPTHRGLGFDRIELAISPSTGFALETRVFVGEREIRRVLIERADLVYMHGRRLPKRRQIVMLPGEHVTELSLRNALVDIDLPDRLFTKQGLLSQRFPRP